MLEPEILAYYARNDERDRLASGERRIEFLRVRDLLARFLPPPPATVLDVGEAARAGTPSRWPPKATTSDRPGKPVTPSSDRAILSPMTVVGMLVLPEVMAGMSDASAT